MLGWLEESKAVVTPLPARVVAMAAVPRPREIPTTASAPGSPGCRMGGPSAPLGMERVIAERASEIRGLNYHLLVINKCIYLDLRQPLSWGSTTACTGRRHPRSAELRDWRAPSGPYQKRG